MDLLKAHVISPLTLLVVTLGFKSVARGFNLSVTLTGGQEGKAEIIYETHVV